jgi:hypothetical protein
MSAAHCMHRVTLLAQLDQLVQSSAFTQPSFAVPVHRLRVRKVRHPLQRSNLEAGAVAQVSHSLIHMYAAVPQCALQTWCLRLRH